MKTLPSKISLILLSLIVMLSACAPSSRRALNDGRDQQAKVINTEDELPPVVEQDLISTEENFAKMLEEKGSTASDYETLTENIQNGEDVMYVGYTKLKNIKSVFNRNTKELEVSGLAEIMNADKKTVRASQTFHIKGKYKAKSGTINLSPIDKEKTEGVQVRAVVTCLKSDINGKFDCARAIIDLYLKHQNNYYTEQLESTAFEKPTLIDGKEAPAKPQKPELSIEITDPEITNQVNSNTESVSATPSASAAVVIKEKVVIDDSKEEADGGLVAEVEEGDDGSIQGRFEGTAALVKLAKLFEKANDDAKDELTINPEVKQDVKGRLVLTNQAVGSPDQGRLRNASFLKTHLDSYKLSDRIVIANSSTKNYYGTQEMMNVLEAIGHKAYSYLQNRIYISRISDKDGGRLPPSKSHQNGMDVDIGYPTVQGKVGFPIVAAHGSLRKSDFSAAKTLELFKFLMTQTVSPVDRLFVDQSIITALCREAKNQGKFRGSERASYVKIFENLQHVDGHENHYHLRLRCTPNQPDCRHKIYRKMNNCAG